MTVSSDTYSSDVYISTKGWYPLLVSKVFRTTEKSVKDVLFFFFLPQPSPIHTLVPVKIRNSYLKKQNLERAIEDYITEYSVCKCEPCKNGGTLVLIDGACTCMCSSYFKGIACQIPKSTRVEG